MTRIFEQDPRRGDPTDEDESRPPSVRSHLLRLLWVSAATAAALALLITLVIFGPFTGIRAVFITQTPVWGTCLNFPVPAPCHGVPLSTVERSLGIMFPPGTTVAQSTASPDDGLSSRNATFTALLKIANGQKAPFAPEDELPSVPTGTPFSAGIRVLESVNATHLSAYRAKDQSWSAITGKQSDATYVSLWARVHWPPDIE